MLSQENIANKTLNFRPLNEITEVWQRTLALTRTGKPSIEVYILQGSMESHRNFLTGR